MKNDFIITIKYKGKTLTYMSKKDDLLLEKDNNNNIELMKNRTIKILDVQTAEQLYDFLFETACSVAKL